MFHQRASGILLHISSLRGNEAIGTFGKEAFEFIDFLAETHQKYWQILPMGPTGYGNCPYQSFSAHAGNPYFISLEKLIETGLLNKRDCCELLHCHEGKVNYALVATKKESVLKNAILHNLSSITNNNEFHDFCETNKYWLNDYAIFMTLKKIHQSDWNQWENQYKYKQPDAIKNFENIQETAITFEKYVQYIFFQQWFALKNYCNQKNIKIIGDLPIYISYDSADCWAERHLFSINEQGNPIAVAGVPPDCFSATGQLWGNPVYDWEQMQQDNFLWWQKRFQSNFKLYDVLRLDHFRGYAGYWSVPYGEPTAINGEWKQTPGKKLFEILFNIKNQLPIIAEDLGTITDDVKELMQHYHIPGMKILQFAFDSDAKNEFLPHHYTTECIAYTGTHDNNTARGWYGEASKKTKKFARQYLNCKKKNIHHGMMRATWASIASIAIAPMQDLLGTGGEGRMNFPGTMADNWEWRLPANWQHEKIKKYLKKITLLYGR